MSASNSTLNSDYVLDIDALKALAILHQENYGNAFPFPHIVLDNVLPDAALDRIIEEIADLESESGLWYHSVHQHSLKQSLTEESLFGPATRQLIYQLNGSNFLQFLESLTGIDGLLPDPHNKGGGIHSIQRGGFLKIHADFNHYKKFKIERRLNVLLYLNKDWQEDFGGHLELWDSEMEACQKKILPIFNRMVIFNTTDASYHGHPEPLTCPPGTSRKSLALYYYTVGRPEDEQSIPHSTLYQFRPQEKPPVAVADEVTAVQTEKAAPKPKKWWKRLFRSLFRS